MSSDSGTSRTRLFADLFRLRAQLVEVVLSAIVMSAGVGLLSARAYDSLRTRSELLLACGAALTLLPLVYLAFRFLRIRANRVEVDGFIVVKKASGEIVNIDRYDFGYDVWKYSRAAFAENASMKAVWERSRAEFSEKRKAENSDAASMEWADLLQEAAEYYLIEKLSLVLSDYYNTAAREKWTTTMGRDDVPDVVLKNRFLDLFSRPMNQRLPFMNDESGARVVGPGARVVASYAKGGELFNHFELVLPKGSSLRRLGSGTIGIRTNRFELTLSAERPFFATVLPERYLALCHGCNEYENASVYSLNLSVSIRFKFLSLFTFRKWEVYGWVDKFMDELVTDSSKQAYFDRIGWEQVLTHLQIQNRRSGTKGPASTGDAQVAPPSAN